MKKRGRTGARRGSERLGQMGFSTIYHVRLGFFHHFIFAHRFGVIVCLSTGWGVDRLASQQ